MVNIVIGRDEDDLAKYELEGTIYIGKEYIKMENIMSLANQVFLDINKPHLILIAGKRGQGKSYTLASIAESIGMLPKELRKNISVLIFDTMGIFWTMKYPNYNDAELLERWGLKPQGIKNTLVYVPEGLRNLYSEINLPVDYEFTLNPSEISGIEWSLIFNLPPNSLESVYIQKLISRLKERENNYGIQDIISYAERIIKNNAVRDKIIGYFEVAESWGLFSEKSPEIEFFIKPGYINIIDISMYIAVTGGWSIKNLVIGVVSKKIFYKRMLFRKKEELANTTLNYEYQREFPLVWVMIDEAHEAIPKDSVTPATEALIQIIREGRQPGITLVLATQQPGKMHTDVLTQSDIVISHRVTAQMDLEALNVIMRNFSSQDIEIYMNENLPKRKGAALILDDKSERIYPVQIKPRVSWHGGADPTLIRKLWLEQ